MRSINCRYLESAHILCVLLQNLFWYNDKSACTFIHNQSNHKKSSSCDDLSPSPAILFDDVYFTPFPVTLSQFQRTTFGCCTCTRRAAISSPTTRKGSRHERIRITDYPAERISTSSPNSPDYPVSNSMTRYVHCTWAKFLCAVLD